MLKQEFAKVQIPRSHIGLKSLR